ncbi:MAG TPA: glycosyltransferase [Gaiellaceae bacterium]|nr:glycosyltransferase [Gaiellaceae bacterium]
MTRVLLVSTGPVGRRMAGPGVRYFHLARELARRGSDVTLVAPELPDVDVGVEVLPASRLPSRRFVRLARRYDAVLAQQLSPWTMWALAGSPAKVVYDLYDPLAVEVLPLLAEEPARAARAPTYRSVVLSQLVALATGDAFVCASERQRDLWLGMLAALGRLDVDTYAADPTLRGLVDVVPFGLDPEPPAGGGALKGVVPGIGSDDRVLVWAGGIWSWFDPETVVRAVAAVARERGDVRLFFLGTAPPRGELDLSSAAARTRALAAELGLEGRHVFFNDGWVEYGERGRYLADAELGVSAHFDSAETRFAFRTRLLDHFWAGLPTVATGGDVLGDLVAERRLGRAVAPRDVDAFAGALLELLGDDAAYEECRANVAAVRDEFAWPRVAARLAAVLEAPVAAPRPRPAARMAAAGSWHAARGVLARAGARAVAAQVVRTLRRPRVP